MDNVERVRATRVEVARLLGLRYRTKLTDWEDATARMLVHRHLSTLPTADQDSYIEQARASDAEMDWTILDEAKVVKALASAVRSVVRQYGTEKLSATTDDLTQSGRIILAERAAVARRELVKGYGFLQRWIWERLTDLVKYEHRDGSLEAIEDYVEGDANDIGPAWLDEPYHAAKWR